MTAALFPGQGSQAIGMARDFYRQSAAAKQVLDDSEAAIPGLLEVMWEGPEEKLRLTAYQQPALVAAGAAAYRAYLEAGGGAARFAAGHSLGEFTAHVAAGSLPVSQAVQLVRNRGRYMQECVPEGVGAMAAVLKLERQQVEGICREVDGVVEVANLNAPGQVVISGEAVAVAAAAHRLKAQGARLVPLNVSAPFHCSLMRPAAVRLAADLARVRFRPGNLEVVSNVTADVVADVTEAADLLERQVTSAVRWAESVERLAQLGATRFLEFGSGRVLTGLVRRTLPEAQALAVTDMVSMKEAL